MNDRINISLSKLRCEASPSQQDIDSFLASHPGVPQDYLSTMMVFNGGEGWVNASYVRFYPIEQVERVNRIYHVDEFLPGMLLFASTGCGEAYFFNFATAPTSIYKMPFVPFDLEYGEFLSNEFPDFIDLLASEEPDGKTLYEINEEAFQKEVHEKHPIALGGNPNDANNTVLVPTEPHAEMCYFWNKVFSRAKRKA